MSTSKILLLHLSDIHITDEQEPILKRAERIRKAVQNLEHGLDACFLVVSGDIAYFSTEEQYLLAADYFKNL